VRLISRRHEQRAGVAMRVTTRVREDVASVLHSREPPTAASREVSQVADEFGAALEPMHPGSEDPLLAPYFTVEVPDPATAERVIVSLRNCEAVEAVYLKPPDAMP
jgi:hypothetical protein